MGIMHKGMKAVALSLLCAWSTGAQEDTPVVESPTGSGAQGTVLEDQPAVDELPDWLIDIPPEPTAPMPTPRKEEQYVQADEHVVSLSRMFSVSGGDALRMGAIASHADGLRGQFNTLLNIEDHWKYAISIRLLGTTADAARANPIRTRVRIIGKEPNLQIRIFAGGGINIAKLDEAIVTMLLYEYALRGVQPDALPDYLEMPAWLATGLQQAILWKQGRIDHRLYENLFNKGDMMSPEEIVSEENPDQLDAGSRQLYDVSCGVLIMGLLNRQGGADQLRNLLAEALTQEGNPKEVISTHFHELEVDKNSFAKWWAIELAALARPTLTESLTPIESEKLLEEALLVTGMNQESGTPYAVSVVDVQELVKLPDWQIQLRSCLDKLTELNLRCFPGYRAIINEYFRAIGELINGSKPNEVLSILEPLTELRAAYKEASIRGRDYLDWYEITHMGRARESNFDSYIEAMRMLRKESPGPATPISRYLDDIEILHSLQEGEPLPKSMLPPQPQRRKK